MKIFVPPIKCQGIKTKLVPWIKDHADLSSGRWIEPFMGSGVVGFNIRPSRAIFADINPHIIHFYNSIKSGYITSAKAKAFLEKEGALLAQKGEDHYYEIRDRFNNNGDPFDFLFLSRACFNGVVRFNKKGRYNVPFGHKPERFAQAYVTKITNQIKYVESAVKQFDWSFVCKDFRDIVSEATNQDFLYFDPPYIGRHTDYYNSWSEKDEEDLFERLVSTQAKFILSTWHSNQYRHNVVLDKHATRFTILTKEHFYHVGASEDNRNAMLEAIVLNYRPEILDQTAQGQVEAVEQLQLLERETEYIHPHTKE
ncbi:MAG: Dam family site-specific DNA-(adenine-N6)-methyltransferase [Roseiflexaceae bacterium]